MMTANIKTVPQGFLNSHVFPGFKGSFLKFSYNFMHNEPSARGLVVLFPEAEYFQIKTDKVSLKTLC